MSVANLFRSHCERAARASGEEQKIMEDGQCSQKFRRCALKVHVRRRETAPFMYPREALSNPKRKRERINVKSLVKT
jgi:hypothetical protein